MQFIISLQPLHTVKHEYTYATTQPLLHICIRTLHVTYTRYHSHTRTRSYTELHLDTRHIGYQSLL